MKKKIDRLEIELRRVNEMKFGNLVEEPTIEQPIIEEPTIEEPEIKRLSYTKRDA